MVLHQMNSFHTNFLKETIFPSKLSKTVSELIYKQGTQRLSHGRLRLSSAYQHPTKSTPPHLRHHPHLFRAILFLSDGPWIVWTLYSICKVSCHFYENKHSENNPNLSESIAKEASSNKTFQTSFFKHLFNNASSYLQVVQNYWKIRNEKITFNCTIQSFHCWHVGT